VTIFRGKSFGRGLRLGDFFTEVACSLSVSARSVLSLHQGFLQLR
jgi:hypothetical protein